MTDNDILNKGDKACYIDNETITCNILHYLSKRRLYIVRYADGSEDVVNADKLKRV